MPQTVNINGVAISYPVIGDTEWGVEATKFAELVGVVLQKIGQGNQSTTNNIVIGSISSPGNLTVASGDLSVSGNTTLTGNLTANGNTTLGNATSDTIAVTGILNVDSGTLYVNPTDNRVGINDTTPSEALDVTGNALISGTLGVTGNTTITGDVITSIVKASGSGGLTIDSNSGTDVALFGAGGGSGTTLYGGLNGTTATMSGVIFNSDGTVSAPSISFTNDTNTGLYRIGSDKIGIATNGARVGEIGVGYGGFTGNVIQVAYAELTTSGVSGSVTIPVDNTIPQITEGAEILTCSITPLYSNSFLYIESNCFIGENSNVFDSITAALFRDSTTDAISVSFNNASPTGVFGGAIAFNPIYLLARVSASSTSSTTFRLRAGGSSSGVIRWNGANGSQYFNGRLITYIRIIEVQV
jgi:hypothetical protein